MPKESDQQRGEREEEEQLEEAIRLEEVEDKRRKDEKEEEMLLREAIRLSLEN